MIRVLRFIFGARLFPRQQWSEPFTIGGQVYKDGPIEVHVLARTTQVCTVCGCSKVCGDFWRCVPGRWFH